MFKLAVAIQQIDPFSKGFLTMIASAIIVKIAVEMFCSRFETS